MKPRSSCKLTGVELFAERRWLRRYDRGCSKRASAAGHGTEQKNTPFKVESLLVVQHVTAEPQPGASFTPEQEQRLREILREEVTGALAAHLRATARTVGRLDAVLEAVSTGGLADEVASLRADTREALRHVR